MRTSTFSPTLPLIRKKIRLLKKHFILKEIEL